jgi:hypothetical protein
VVETGDARLDRACEPLTMSAQVKAARQVGLRNITSQGQTWPALIGRCSEING